MNGAPRQQIQWFALIGGELIPTSCEVLERYVRAYGNNLPVRFVKADDVREVPHD